jgi:single-strand DNA-binding protein
MPGTLNRVELIGHLGRDPERVETDHGEALVVFSLATNRLRANGQEETDWHVIVVFGQLAETCARHLRKGRYLYVSGRLQTREWEDEEGRQHSRAEIVAREIVFLDAPRDAAEAPSTEAEETL